MDAICNHCRLDTAGQHEFGCPNRRGLNLYVAGKDETLEQPLLRRIAELEAALSRIAPAPDPEVHPPCACGYDDPADVCASHAPLKDSHPEIVAWFQGVGAHISALEGRAENAEATLDAAKLELDAVREQRKLLVDEAERGNAECRALEHTISRQRWDLQKRIAENERDKAALKAANDDIALTVKICGELPNVTGTHQAVDLAGVRLYIADIQANYQAAARREKRAEAQAKAANERAGAAEARYESVSDGLVGIQRNRDAWRRYAYEGKEKPDDFVDGNMPMRAATAIEKLRERAERSEANHDEVLVPLITLAHELGWEDRLIHVFLPEAVNALRAELEQAKAVLVGALGTHGGAGVEDIVTVAHMAANRIDNAKQENARLRERECAECGRALPPDGDCYGCEVDRLREITAEPTSATRPEP